MSAQAFGTGAAQAAGSNLTQAVLNTPQAQQAVQFTANSFAQGGAAVVGGAIAAGSAVAGAGTAAVAAGTALAVAAAPVVAVAAGVGVVVWGVSAFIEWLDS